MTTYAENLAASHQRWNLSLRIEGVGLALSAADLALADGDARLRISFGDLPGYAASQPAGLWVRDVVEPYDIQGERADVDGGVVDLGTLSAKVLGRALLSYLAPDVPPIGFLAADATATTLTLRPGTVVAAGSIARVEAELVYVTSVAGDVLTVRRGALGSAVRPHLADAPLYASTARLEGLRMDVVRAVVAGTPADERTIGTYILEGVSAQGDFLSWTLEGSQRALGVKATLASTPRVLRVIRELGAGTVDLTGVGDYVDYLVWPFVAGEPGPYFYFRADDEVLGGSRMYGRRVVRTGERDVLGTGQADLRLDEEARQVFVAGRGGFRWSPGPVPATVRDATFTHALHFVPIALILMTSSADADDGLEMTNYDPAWGNFATLPPGYGAGMLAQDIDFASFFDVWQRTPDLIFPNFVFGDEPVALFELLTQSFFRAAGVTLSFAGGKARLLMPTTPLVDEAATTIDPTGILRRQEGEHLVPRASLVHDRAHIESGVALSLGPIEQLYEVIRTPHVAQDADQGLTQLSVPGADYADGPVFAKRQLSRLRRTSLPRSRVTLDTFFRHSDLRPGDLIRLTLPGAPDFAGGAGLVDAVCAVTAVEPRLVLGGEGLYAVVEAAVYGAGSLGRRVCPAGSVASVSGNQPVLVANRYTHADALGGLPTTDLAGFAVGDVVRVRGRDGADLGGGNETVDSVTPLTLSGDFGGALVAGTVLSFADYADCTAAQIARFAFAADEATLSLGTSGPDVYVGA